ncbi:flagellar assembly peptidoglycan hydrolase FlgJ [Lysobacter sp. D1-1-M9]|uniref:flagellar assembly peptidoglycan hydrolase FlgJ n=1 Tax=Novilysobacter longmucuonensis TaxID=3098603 RepID=UPI002FC7D642
MRLPSATELAITPQPSQSRERLQTAARELESQFAQLMLKSMRSASMGDSMLGDNTMYRDMYDQQLSREITKGQGLGLAPMIVRQLERGSGGAEGQNMSAAPMPLPQRAPAATLPMAMPYSHGGSMMKMAASMTGGFALAPSRSGVSMPALDVAASRPPASSPAAPGLAADQWSPDRTTGEAAAATNTPLDCSSPEAFVKSIWPHAQRTAAELGVSAKALVAQAALETGWGRRLAGGRGETSSHNLFGIKTGSRWSGERVNSATHEFVGGVRRNERTDFRAYGSIHDSFADYAQLMRNERYAGALAAGNDTGRFASALQQAGYATDPSYAAKISAIANGPTLQRALGALDEKYEHAHAALPDPTIRG